MTSSRTGPTFFWFFTGLQLVAAVIFAGVAAWYRPALAETSVEAEEPARSAA